MTDILHKTLCLVVGGPMDGLTLQIPNTDKMREIVELPVERPLLTEGKIPTEAGPVDPIGRYRRLNHRRFYVCLTDKEVAGKVDESRWFCIYMEDKGDAVSVEEYGATFQELLHRYVPVVHKEHGVRHGRYNSIGNALDAVVTQDMEAIEAVRWNGRRLDEFGRCELMRLCAYFIGSHKTRLETEEEKKEEAAELSEEEKAEMDEILALAHKDTNNESESSQGRDDLRAGDGA